METRQTRTNSKATPARQQAKRYAIYARVSTQEQGKGQYPSCDSQLEELQDFCKRNGWEVFEAIKDEGHRAGTLRRPGLTRLRWLVEAEEIDGIVCTWYNRLIGSRDFYVLDKEFKAHNVKFVTVHDPTDRNTASGRLLESMLVTIKTFENEQVAEKVRTKMRQRSEKGLWNGGPVLFGCIRDPQSQRLLLDPEKAPLVPEIFQTYVDTASDFAVRDWFQARQIPSPGGKSVWPISTIHNLLKNRRYVGEVELNKQNRELDDVPEHEAFRVVATPHEPLVSKELFEMAQAIRQEKATNSPNRKGRPRDYSQNQCNRVFPLQGSLYCSVCGHAMTPYYAVHKAGREKSGKLRRKDSYFYYYVCALQQMKGRSYCKHSNRVSARVSESWIVDRIKDVVTGEDVLEKSFAMARAKCESDLLPQQQEAQMLRQGLRENQAKIDNLIDFISSGSVSGDLMALLNGKATELRLERQRLLSVQRNLSQSLAPLGEYADSLPLRETLGQFVTLAEAAEPEEMQRLLRTMVQRIEWSPDGNHAVDFYALPSFQNKRHRTQKAEHDVESYSALGFERNIPNDSP